MMDGKSYCLKRRNEQWCPCLCKRTKAILASWFFTMLHFATFVFMCVKIEWATNAGFIVLNVVGFLAILTALAISSASIYGVHSRKEKYMVPFEWYLIILVFGCIVGFIGGLILIPYYDVYTGVLVSLISCVIMVISARSVSSVREPLSGGVRYVRSSRNGNFYYIEPSVRYINKNPSVIPNRDTSGNLSAAEPVVKIKEEKVVILLMPYNSNSTKPALPTSGQ